MKFVLVTGGVVSGLGKGVTASSIGVLLKECGLKVTSIKIDPYVNVDAGTMSPFEHGEVFVLDDGGESDLDLGNYERFLDITLTSDHNITTGKIYSHVIAKERRGDYLGKTVQIVPHITDAIQSWVSAVSAVPVDGSEAGGPDVCILELGGTVGDIESMPFVEALRQFQFKNDMCVVHVSLVPSLGPESEQKTKPTQHSVQSLRSAGLSPDVLACRSDSPLSHAAKEKLALFCHVDSQSVLNLHNVNNIWEVPQMMHSQNASFAVLRALRMGPSLDALSPPDLSKWNRLANALEISRGSVKIAIIGKYTGLTDSYLSVIKALTHACADEHLRPELLWVEASELTQRGNSPQRPSVSSPATPQHQPSSQSGGSHNNNGLIDNNRSDSRSAWERLQEADGVLVPGGFGSRGLEGKLEALRHARESNKPTLGICLGLQLMGIEVARNVLGFEHADSAEADPDSPDPVVIFMPEGSTTHKGGTLRVGTRRTGLVPGCTVQSLYAGSEFIHERHRHRYELAPAWIEALRGGGLDVHGWDDTKQRAEVVEMRHHSFYVGVQFHPEFKSRPGRPAPVFAGLVRASSDR